MILADKIIMLRKRHGWSQEELAERLDVSRQTVSKWEGALSVPDLNKVLAMSRLFGVSTDYLLKDELEEVSLSETASADDGCAHSVSAEEANRYMDTVARLSRRIAVGVMLCILSPVCLILLAGAVDEGAPWRISAGAAVAIGLIALFALVAAAVSIFIPTGLRLSEFSYLEKEVISLEYGVRGIVEKKRESDRTRYLTRLVLGIVLCICSAVPLIVLGALDFADYYLVCATALILVVCAGAVAVIVQTCYVQGSYQKLLQTGEFTVEIKRDAKENEATDTAYWCICTALYLGVSFLTFAWHITWIVWPVAGCLFPAYRCIVNAIKKK